MTEEKNTDDGGDGEDVPNAFRTDSGPNKNKMTDKWLPGKDHWLVKTFLDRGDAGNVVGIHATAKLNPETSLDELNEEILPKHYEALVSEDGEGFKNYQSAIEAMHGKSSDGGDGGSISFEAAVAPEDD